MSDAPRYEISTVTDFLKVPAKRRAACLRDFREYLKVVEPMREAVEGITGGPTSIMPRFTWIDDGVAGVSSLKIVAPDATITLTGKTQLGTTPGDAHQGERTP